jgi:hypothetical protein
MSRREYWITDITGAMSSLALWQYVQVWIRLQFGGGWPTASTLPQALGSLTGSHGRPPGWSSSSGFLVLTDVGQPSGLHARGCHIPHAAHSVTSRRRLYRTSSLVAPSPGRSGMRCCPGFDQWAKAIRSTPGALRKGTSSVILLMEWWIWKHSNAAVFDNAQPSVAVLLETIKAGRRCGLRRGLEVFASCSPRPVSLRQVICSGVRPILGLYINLLFYQCIEMQCLLSFREKNQFNLLVALATVWSLTWYQSPGSWVRILDFAIYP